MTCLGGGFIFVNDIILTIKTCVNGSTLNTPSYASSACSRILLAPRRLAKAEIGDTLVIEGTGAYASGMNAKNYNAFPEAAEVMIDLNGDLRLVRQRQTLDQVLQNEI